MQGRIQKAGSSSGLDVRGMVTTGTDNIRVHGHISIVLIVCSKHCDRKEVQYCSYLLFPFYTVVILFPFYTMVILFPFYTVVILQHNSPLVNGDEKVKTGIRFQSAYLTIIASKTQGTSEMSSTPKYRGTHPLRDPHK
jgi:hypothetical protein